MLVRCPKCGTEFRLVEFQPEDRVVRYLCPGCQQIVGIDLEQDEIESSSSSGSFSALDRPMTVLIADDSENILKLVSAALAGEGYNVLLAGDGAEALEVVRQHHPDLVVLDLLMPRKTGFDVLREIRADERIRDTKVLAMSGVYKDNVVEFLQQLGAEGFLDKERITDTLAFRIRQILGGAGRTQS